MGRARGGGRGGWGCGRGWQPLGWGSFWVASKIHARGSWGAQHVSTVLESSQGSRCLLFTKITIRRALHGARLPGGSVGQASDS